MGSPPSYNYICSGPTGLGTTLAPGYAAYPDNKAVLQAAWPNAWVDSEDIFAHAYAQTYFTGDYQGSGIRTSEKYFTGSFQCSKFFAKLTGDTGRIPVSTSMPSGCPSISAVSKCKQLFVADDRFPGDGFIFDCQGPPATADATQTAQALSDMANPAGNAPMPQIQEDLKDGNTYVFMFDDQPDFWSVFNAAVAPTPLTSQVEPAFGAITYPAGDMKYVIIFKSNATVPPVTQTIVQEKETTSHELGHAIDFIYGTANQSESTAWTRFVLNDLLFLDYTFVDPNSQGGSSPRPACSSNGTAPFDGYAPVCTGATVNPAYAGKRNSEIAQIIDPFLFKRWNATIGWRELYATTFGAQALTPPATTLNPLYRQFWLTGVFFDCTISWGDALVAGQPTPPTNGTCGNAVPNWYVPLVSSYYRP